jgi:hypothetical protein
MRRANKIKYPKKHYTIINLPKGVLKMLSFQEADKFVTEKSSRDIFTRTVLYIAWAQGIMHKQYGHHILAMMVAALSGPFDSRAFDDPAIKELLDWTDYAWESKWGSATDRWARKHCKTQQELMHYSHMCAMVQQKEDEVYHYLEQNARDLKPLQYYFPELEPLGFLNERKWPRI